MFGGHIFAIVQYTFFFYLKSVELIRVLCNIMIFPTHTHANTHVAISGESRKSAKEIM